MESKMAAIAALLCAVVAGGCARTEEPDAYGNVEAVEVTVSAEAAGRLMTFSVEEGQPLTAGAVVGTIDPVPLQLQQEQAEAQRAATVGRVEEVARQVPVLEAQRGAALAQRESADAQRAALDAQLTIARRNLERTQRLIAQEAATVQQLDQAEREVRTLEEQVRAQARQTDALARQAAAYDAQIAAVVAQRNTARQQVASAAAQVAQVEDRIRRARIVNPAAGTVLVRYVRAAETVQVGQPLYQLADLSQVDVRAYVTESQLANVKAGQQVRIGYDVGEGQRTSLSGTVTSVASRAEFTPTPIQTRDERGDLVYAVRIRVANTDGALKIGMPVDVEFGHGR